MKCHSVKSKGSDKQCPHKIKKNNLCGIHCRSKNVVLFKDVANLDNIITKKSNKIVKNIKYKNKSYEPSEFIRRYKHKKFDTNKLQSTFDLLKIDNIEQLFKFFSLELDFIKHNNALFQRLERFIQFANKTHRNHKFINNHYELATMDPIANILPQYFITMTEEDGTHYAFDIRTILKLNDPTINPFTSKTFLPKDINKIQRHKQYLRDNSISLEIDNDKLTPIQERNNKLLKLSQGFDMMGYYFDEKWITDLGFYQLKQLYRNAEDVFNFRSQLTENSKEQLVNGGSAFGDIFFIDLIPEEHKNFLLERTIEEMSKFIFEGKTQEDRVLGANLMLTALVEISFECGMAFPHLVQSNLF